VAAADVVVVASLGLGTDQNRQVLDGLKALHPHVPLVVLAWQADLDQYRDLLDGCHTVTFPWTLRKLRAAVQEAADRRRTDTVPGPWP
jgi:hypothetical protein